MDLLVIRHARAADRETFAKSDAQRPLTRAGAQRMTKAMRGLRAMVPSIDLLVSSRLRRAVQTARIIANAYGDLRVELRDELSPGAPPEQLIAWLGEQGKRGFTCIVGHEPDLSELLALLLADPARVPAKLKKGSASLVRFKGRGTASAGKLKWHRTAKELAALR